MNFSEFRLSSDPNIIGVNNGTLQIEFKDDSFSSEKDRLLFNSFYIDEHYWQSGNYVSDIKIGNLAANAYPKSFKTHFISFAPYLPGFEFVVTSEAYRILLQYKMPKHKVFTVCILGNKQFESEVFYLINWDFIGFESINFQDSMVFTGIELLGKSYHPIKNLNEYKNFMVVNPIHTFESVRLNEKDLENDIMFLKAVGMFMSVGLKNELPKSGLGLNFPDENLVTKIL